MAVGAKFNEDSTASEVATFFANDIKGKNVLVTGVSPKGLGETAALAFASGEPNILILASRTKSNLDTVAETIKDKYPGVDVRLVVVDLAQQASIRTAADEIKQLVSKIDILVNNAAAVNHTRQWTAEHIEFQFGTNHIGPFLLTNLLMPLLRAAAQGAPPGRTRIVNVSSGGHRLSPIRFHDIHFEGKPIPDEEKPAETSGRMAKTDDDGYPPFIAYGQCKTANILFSLYLQQQLRAAGIASYGLHPGTIHTNLGRDAKVDPLKDGDAKFPPPNWKFKTLDGGSATTLVAALDPALDEPTGVYLSDCAIEQPAPHAKDPDAAEKLWHLSEEMVGEKFPLD